jgi:hypothetical protein
MRQVAFSDIWAFEQTWIVLQSGGVHPDREWSHDVLTKRPIRLSKYQEHGKRGHEAIDADLESERPGKRNVVTVNSDPYRQFESEGDTSKIWSGHPTTQAWFLKVRISLFYLSLYKWPYTLPLRAYSHEPWQSRTWSNDTRLLKHHGRYRWFCN